MERQPKQENITTILTLTLSLRAGWKVERQTGSHVHLSKEGNANILSIFVHKGKPVKQGLLRNQIGKAGLSIEEFLKMYK